MKSPQNQTRTDALERWQRIGLGIRLAYNPARPDVLRVWLELGARLVRQGLVDEPTALRRTLRLLMQTAHDDALPWAWRSACLDHTARPLARLTSVLRLHDPLQVPALHAMVQAAHERLNAAARWSVPRQRAA